MDKSTFKRSRINPPSFRSLMCLVWPERLVFLCFVLSDRQKKSEKKTLLFISRVFTIHRGQCSTIGPSYHVLNSVDTFHNRNVPTNSLVIRQCFFALGCTAFVVVSLAFVLCAYNSSYPIHSLTFCK